MQRIEYIKKDLSQVNHQLHESLAIFNERSNRGGRTPSASADTLAGTSETNGRSSTTDSISQNAGNVNSESQKGKKFALAGETSETADLSLLDRAKQLQAAGEDSETIRRETGWFVGYDNQWRYEIDDSAATLVEKPAFENHSTEDGGS